MENIFKELFLKRSQGVSLSIADAKVDTFYILTKHYYYFFLEKIQEKSHCADFQAWRILEIFKNLEEIDKYMLQNIKIERFLEKNECKSENSRKTTKFPYSAKKSASNARSIINHGVLIQVSTQGNVTVLIWKYSSTEG